MNLEVNTEEVSSSFNPNRLSVEDVTSTVIEAITSRRYQNKDIINFEIIEDSNNDCEFGLKVDQKKAVAKSSKEKKD